MNNYNIWWMLLLVYKHSGASSQDTSSGFYFDARFIYVHSVGGAHSKDAPSACVHCCSHSVASWFTFAISFKRGKQSVIINGPRNQLLKMNAEQLILSVYYRKAPWNQSHSDHRNRCSLDKLWREVASECNVTGKYFICIYK